VLELLDDVDVLVENMAPGALERLGLGYRVLSDRNPAVCVLSLPALHPGDALGDLRGYAPVFTGMGGLEILATPVEGSRAVGMLETGWGDPNGGTVGLLGLLAALVRRARTGVGVHVICSQVKAVTWQLDRAFFRHTSPVGLRPEHGGSDGDWQVVLPVDDGGWLAVGGDPAKALTVVAGLGLTSRDLLAEWSKSRSSAEVARAFRAGGLHTAPVITAEDAARAERARVRGVAEEIDHPLLGPVARFHVPWLLDGVAPRCDGRPPALGEGAEELLRAPRDAAPERRCEHD
jgi:crotonobetainyl-CoA:carnitine CoA-transferase CaiB-like acyl-CoA transferase